MSDSTDSQPTRESSAEYVRDRELLGTWLKVAIYGTFVPFCVFAAIYLVRSYQIQAALASATQLLRGSLTERVESLQAPEAQQALEVLKEHPVRAFLFCNQAILQDEDGDPRMARGFALRKAAHWGVDSARREIVRKILENLSEEGSVSPDFVLTDSELTVLRDMVAERVADPEMTYAETRITEVLQWVAEGYPGQPRGVEQRRMRSLQDQLEKGLYTGSEAGALRAIQVEWAASDDPVARACAEKMTTMLAGERTELTDEGRALCLAEAAMWEARYEESMTNLSHGALVALRVCVEQDEFIDHPHIYQALGMLGSRFDGVRADVRECAWLLRHNRFNVRFLAKFATNTTVNPVMAVETSRQSKEQRERQMARQNSRRMQECARLLRRIGLDYIEHPAEYAGIDADPLDYIESFVVHPLEDVAGDDRVHDICEAALADLRAADMASPGGPRLFAE